MIASDLPHLVPSSPPARRLVLVGLVLTFLLPLLNSGCGSNHALHPVSPATARQALEKVLDGWKEGKAPDAWRGEKPEIVVQDVDWSMGKKLVGYEIVGEGKAVDANLHCEVKLELSDGTGTVSKAVTYLVSTSPVVTVFRQIVP